MTVFFKRIVTISFEGNVAGIREWLETVIIELIMCQGGSIPKGKTQRSW